MTAVTNTFSTKKFYNIKVLSRFYLFFSSSQHRVLLQVFLWGCTGLVYSLSGKTQGIKYLWAHSNNLRQLRQAYQHFYQLISFLKMWLDHKRTVCKAVLITQKTTKNKVCNIRPLPGNPLYLYIENSSVHKKQHTAGYGLCTSFHQKI